jgi:CPA2 family monovalent cation:H+ antiporter-2
VAFVFSSPFIWALAFGRLADEDKLLQWAQSRYAPTLIVIDVVRCIFTVALCAFLSSLIVSAGVVIGGVAFIVVAALFVLSRYFKNVYMRLEGRFVHNLHEKENSQTKRLPELAPWDSHLTELRVSPNSQLIGKTLSELTLREKFGVTIALVERGRQVIPAPGRNEVLYPFDVLQVIGTDEQIGHFKQVCENLNGDGHDFTPIDYGLRPIFVEANAPYARKTIRECGLREATKGLVVGIEKKGRRTLNPDSTTLIEPGDVLWIVGIRTLMTSL